MKKELTYIEAYSKLEELVEQLEEGNIPLEKLTLKVKQANEFIAICEGKLRLVEDEIKSVTKASTSTTKRKRAK